MEIGAIDTTGHTEQSNIVKRINELFSLLNETIESILKRKFEK